MLICEVFLSTHSEAGNSAFSNSKQCLKCARLFFSKVLCNSLCREYEDVEEVGDDAVVGWNANIKISPQDDDE